MCREKEITIEQNNKRITIKPEKIGDFGFRADGWDDIDLTKLTTNEMKIMLQTCTHLLTSRDNGDVATSWVNVLSHKLSEKTNRWFLILGTGTFLLSVITLFIAIIRGTL